MATSTSNPDNIWHPGVCQAAGTPRYSTVPPESNKAYDKGVLAQLWKNAASAPGLAEQIVLIGYSLPVADLHATALFRALVRPGPLQSPVVVNPDSRCTSR